MTRPIKASEHNLEPHYKVRVVYPGSILHLASRTEPQIDLDVVRKRPLNVQADWIADPAYGDTPGHLDWRETLAVTWRWSA